MVCVGEPNSAKAVVAAEAAVAVFPNVQIATPEGPRSLPDIMVAIAGQESAYDPTATNGLYIGLWQIGSNHEGVRTFFHVPAQEFTAWLKIPRNNALAARHLMAQRGTNWNVRLSAWSTWTSGAYLACLPSANQIVAHILATQHQTAVAKKRTIRRHAALATTAYVGINGAAIAAVLAVILL